MSRLNSLKSENLPSTWRLLPVGKVLLDTQYGTNESAIDGGNTKVVGMKDIQDGKVLTADLTSSNLSNAEKKHYLLNKGDLLINRTNSYDLVGKVGIFTSDEEIAFASYLVRLTVDRAHLFYRHSQGLTSDTWNLKYHHFQEIKVTIPEIEEQKAIARTLKACDEELDLLKKQAEAYRGQKRGLMQRLLTGEWRVRVG